MAKNNINSAGKEKRGTRTIGKISVKRSKKSNGKKRLIGTLSRNDPHNDILLHAALESMTDAFTVWDYEQRLITFNKKYEQLYFAKVPGLKPGMTLRQVCELSVKNGNDGGMSANELYKKYSSILHKTAKSKSVEVIERKVNGRYYRSSFIQVPNIGQIVTQKDITDEVKQKRQEKEKDKQIARQNYWFGVAINSMSQGLCAFDENKRLIICNEVYKNIYKLPKRLTKPGAKYEDILKYRIKKGLIPEGETAESHYANRIELAKSSLTEKIFTEYENGRYLQIMKNSMPNGGWIGIIQDVSEEVKKREIAKEKDRQIAKQNLLINTAISNMSHGLSMFGPDHRLIICNEIYAKFYGLPKKLVKPGTKFKDILEYRLANNLACKNESKEEFLKKRLKFIDGKPEAKEFVENVKNRLISVIRRPMEDGGWVATHQDITEQRKREELIEQRSKELEQQNMRFDAAVNNMGHALSMFDKNHKLIICNEAYKNLYKLPKRLLKPGSDFWDILEHGAKSGMVSIADKQQRFEALNRVIENKKIVKGPIKMLNGRIVYIQHYPLKDGGWLATHEDITEQHKSEELIRHMARHDGLTGLLNRRAFRDLLREGEKAINNGKKMALLCIDLDHFKPVNDNFGHGAGDAVLKLIAKRISSCVGDMGQVARLGGDEFAAFIGPVKSKRAVEKIAKKIIEELSKPVCWEEIEVIVGASIGIALAPKNGKNAESLMHNADLATYHIKKSGRGNYCFFDKTMDRKQKKRRAIEQGLKTIIEKNELQLYFQPLISLKTSQISCCEALMRWETKRGKKYSPMEFIPVAEETGMIREMGNWALIQACQSAAKWSNNVRVAVNISPIQFSSGDLVEQVALALEISSIAADRLELEITESVPLAESDRNLEILHKLKQLGVRIALDDFGTGYSSLGYLRAFPFDKVKIDRSFISSLKKKPESIALIKAVVDIGASLNMSVTAEGIETEEQLRAVFKQNCHEVQGYLFSPPLPQKSIERLLSIKNVQNSDEITQKKNYNSQK